MASNFDTDIASIKQKLNNLRTRSGKELSKERNTKSSQATEYLYNSNWPFFYQLAFLTPVIGASKSRDTSKRTSVNNDDDNEDEVTSSNQRKPTVAEKTICKNQRKMIYKKNIICKKDYLQKPKNCFIPTFALLKML